MEATGFSGGVWILWDEDEISLKLEYIDKFFLQLMVNSAGGLEREITAVYVSANPTIKWHLWEKLDGIEVSQPRVLVKISTASCIRRKEVPI